MPALAYSRMRRTVVTMLPHPISFIANTNDDLHCFQSALRMGWQAIFGEELSQVLADKYTDFRAGAQTWPFRGLLSIAQHGGSVVNVEDFDPESFVRSPRHEILRQTGDEEVANHIMSVADAAREVPVVRDLLEHPAVTFTQRVPTSSDLIDSVNDPDCAVICNINQPALMGRPGYNGHFVLVEGYNEGVFRIQDPGLPPLQDHDVPSATLLNAWTSPSPGLANIMKLVRPTQHPVVTRPQ